MRQGLHIFYFLFFTNCIFGQNFTKSNLPILVINTQGQEILDEPKIIANMTLIHDPLKQENSITDIPNEYNGKIGIEIRGSSSQMFPKKGYGFETRKDDGSNNNVALLGMPQENDWVLHGPYSDKSLIRNMLCYILAGDVMDYAPRGRYCELVINGNYLGVYVLMEKIKRDKGRVNISDLTNVDNTGDKLTGGYIIKIDKETGSNNGGWFSTYKPVPGAPQVTYFQYDFPKASDMTLPQRNYIRQFFTEVENSVNAPNYTDPVNGYRKYIDDRSLMDYILMNELSKNPDAYRLSTYMYKDRDSKGGKLKFGPVWDYNLGFGNVNYCTDGSAQGLVISGFNQVCPFDSWLIHFWWNKFMDDSKFKSDLKQRWFQLRQNELSDQRIHFVVDSLTSLLSASQVRNFQKWPVLNEYIWPNNFVGGSYALEIDYLKNWLQERLLWLDNEFGSYTSVLNIQNNFEIKAYPNPASEYLTLNISGLNDYQKVEILKVRDGSLVKSLQVYQQANVTESRINISDLETGLYILKIISGNASYFSKFVKL
ncbi:MAG: CotH kinase family protein [Saprospiraceae bacterium]|nr:CotH kinase family protein [Saprospiraceae bacterium]